MLTVAAPSPGTAAERLAYRLFTQWDSGVRVLGGIAAFRSYDDTGTKRRQSDVVMFVPDGVIVVRLVGSQRQSGPIVAHPTGAWSIGGEVLRIAGGGSNPISGLREAQSALTVMLRASGLEPGRVAMLVAAGSGEPVQPQDGKLTDGVIVCPLTEEGLAIGVRRAAALTAAGDVRQWTTADVKAALAAINASGRVPAVEELNAEGFMYSPYILRRPDLVAAASAVAAATNESNGVNARYGVAGSGESAAPLVDDGGPPTQSVGLARYDRDEGDSDERDSDERDSDERSDQSADVGLGEILGDDSGERQPPARMPAASLRSLESETDDGTGYAPGYERGYAGGISPAQSGTEATGDRRRGLRMVAVLVALVLIGGAAFVGFRMFVGDPDGSSQQAGTTTTAVQTAEQTAEQTTSEQPSTQQIRDHEYLLALSRDDDTCAENANGRVAEYLTTTDCTALVRELYTTDLDGTAVLVSVARVTMPDEASASDFKGIVDSDGTGNIDDLFEAGMSLPEGPTELQPGAYASELNGNRLTIVVVGWSDPAAPGDPQALKQLALEALELQPAG